MILSLLVFLWGTPQVKNLLNGTSPITKPAFAGVTKIDFPIEGLDNRVQRLPPVVAKPTCRRRTSGPLPRWWSGVEHGARPDRSVSAAPMSESPRSALPRYLPDESLPPYAYLPRRTPHPTRDPTGHSHGHESVLPPVPDISRWNECRPYLRGIDLFNHGYYWEAHEAWESLWHACGRTGPTADFLRGLIRLAAAGFKAKEGHPAGVERHAAAASQLFGQVAAELEDEDPRYMGLSLGELARFAAEARRLSAVRDTGLPAQMVVFPFVLRPA